MIFSAAQTRPMRNRRVLAELPAKPEDETFFGTASPKKEDFFDNKKGRTDLVRSFFAPLLLQSNIALHVWLL